MFEGSDDGMSAFLIKLLSHPLFRLLFWSVLMVWLFVMGLFSSGWFRFINFIMAIISLGNVFDNIVKSVKYFQKTKKNIN